MPSHPDRVRRNYVDPPDGPRARALTTGQTVVCVRCGRPDHPGHEAWMGHPFEAPVSITDNGFTANVIEGEEH